MSPGATDVDAMYPFDPYDWRTITPLFEALNDVSVSPHGFANWLTQWNALDIAVYDAWVQIKRRSYAQTTDRAAEHAYHIFTREIFSTYLGLTNTLITRALALQPDPPSPSYRQLWRRWHNQTALFHPASLPLQAKISELESSYRELTRRIEQVPGDATAQWLDRRMELNELMLQLVKLRRELAHTSGLPAFLAYRWRELGRLDYSIEECQAFHRAIEQVVVPVAQQLRAPSGGVPLPSIADAAMLSDGIERILTNVDATFGRVFHAMRPNFLDLGQRQGKADTDEQWFFPRAGMPYLHVTSSNPATLLHESGHAAHAYLSFQAQRSLWNYSGPEEFQEFVAITMEELCWPYYNEAQGGPYTRAESRALRQHSLNVYLEGLTWTAMEDAFEHWVYGEAPEDVTSADLDTKWLELKQRFMPWNMADAPELEAMTSWQRGKWSLFRMPLYMMSYAVAIVGACQVGRHAETDRTRAISDYKAAVVLGNTKPLPELFHVAGLTFPFTQQAVEEAVQFIVEQSSKISVTS